MTFDKFFQICHQETLPENLDNHLMSLWYDFRGDWDTAHSIAQTIDTTAGSWIHAYLHRKEENQVNASYWYSRAGKPEPEMELLEEWKQISRAILEKML